LRQLTELENITLLNDKTSCFC